MEPDELTEAGESYKAFRGKPLTTLAERAAEMAYRRGYQRGFNRATAYIQHGASVQEVAKYEYRRIWRWRQRGQKEGYRHAEPPPDDIFAGRARDERNHEK